MDAIRSATTVHQAFPTIMGYIPLNQEPKSTFLKLLFIATREVTNSSSKVLGGQTFGTWYMYNLATQNKVIVMETTYTKKHKILLWEHCAKVHVVQRVEQVLPSGETYWPSWGGVGFRQGTAPPHFRLFIYRQDPCSTHPFPEHSLGSCTWPRSRFLY